MTYEVVKTISGRRYRYLQWTYREGGRVKTGNQYLGPADGDADTSTGVDVRPPQGGGLDTEAGSGKRRKRGILGVLDELVSKKKAEPQETEEQIRERVAAEDREYAERDRINEALSADTISLDTISEIAASQAETVASDTVAESADTTTGAGESEAAAGEAGGEGEADGDAGDGGSV